MKPKVVVVSFPGNNCEVESIRAINRNGMEAVPFRWNDDTSKLTDIDGYFIPGGFSYEDRGRSGMVAGRDPLLDFIKLEAAKGKVVIGNCNGAQILVESGLIPLNQGLRMSLARNTIGGEGVGFLNEWVWITPTCAQDRCATSNWKGAMHMPMAHGEGRFTTRDKDVIKELKEKNQIAFSYCDAEGNVSEDPIVTPNGSLFAIAGLCNPEGNVIALMPHPERTEKGDPYFASMKKWMEKGKKSESKLVAAPSQISELSTRSPHALEIFIDTIITNNEERTVEQAARRLVPGLKLKQLRYLALSNKEPASVLKTISLFNPNKEIAYVRREGGQLTKWNSALKIEENSDIRLLQGGVSLLRRDEPDTGANALGKGSETGICYVCSGVSESDLQRSDVQEIFANPHASTLERLS